MLSEAAKVGYISGGDAIHTSIDYYGVYGETSYANFMALPDVVYDAANGLKYL